MNGFLLALYRNRYSLNGLCHAMNWESLSRNYARGGDLRCGKPDNGRSQTLSGQAGP